ncbi:hypothetical protein BurMR1_1914 [Burkholderia sp. MR1]|nr:hypothetical protein BurMR1_1914 [Burkholderia sp. MR1]
MLGQVKVRATKQTRFDIAALRTSIDQSGGFKIVETAIEGPHGLQRAAREQFAARKDGGEGLGGVNGSRKGGQDSASARGDLFDVGGPKCCPEDDPGQVGRVAAKSGEGRRICGMCFALAGNEALHDRHVERSIARNGFKIA